MAWTRRSLTVLTVCLAASGCRDASGPGLVTPDDEVRLVQVLGENQRAVAGSRLRWDLVVRALGPDDQPRAGVPVAWALSEGQGRLSGAAVTDEQGYATASLVATSLGSAAVSARASGSSQDVIFRSIVTQTTVPIVSAGRQHTCGINAAGALYCWGSNEFSQLGTQAALSSCAGVPCALQPALVANDSGLTWRSVSAGRSHTCAVATTGSAWCWGNGGWGVLGNGSNANSPVPVRVPFGLWAYVVAGDEHTCAVGTDGVAYCWGRNQNGQVGSGSIQFAYATTPTPVAGPWRFTSLSAGERHTCGVTTLNGSPSGARCWGSNYHGQLGTGDRDDAFSPANPVVGLTFTAIEAGARHTCGVATFDRPFCWGSNQYGQFGDGDNGVTDFIERINMGSSVPVPTGTSDFYTDVEAGHFHTCGLTTSQALRCWGTGALGIANHTSTQTSFTPAAVTPGITWHTFTAGRNHNCAITTTNEAWCWGDNFYGQLGDGSRSPAPRPYPGLPYQPTQGRVIGFP
jgi:alpha-tubulin suppressor-like RCC1 family protein